MLAGLFRSNQPGVLLALLVLVPLLFGPTLLVPYAAASPAMPLTGMLEAVLAWAPWTQGVIGMVLIMAVSVQLTLLVNDTELMERRNHLPAFLFPVLFAAFSRHVPFDPALAGMPLVILALRRTWSMTNTGGALGVLFDAGLLLGLAALFYLPYAFLVVVVWASASVIRPFQWREYVVPFVSCTVVFYMAWAVLHLLGHDHWHPLHTIAHTAGPGRASAGPIEPQRAILYAVLAPLLLVAAVIFGAGYQRSVMREKNLRSSFLAFVVALGVLIILVGALNKAFPPVLLATPLAVFAGYGLLGTRRAWLSETAAFALLGLGLWAQWAG
ncbi:MAG: hypothetical protein ABI432_09405 [Flavobacteriales bacterium]